MAELDDRQEIEVDVGDAAYDSEWTVRLRIIASTVLALGFGVLGYLAVTVAHNSGLAVSLTVAGVLAVLLVADKSLDDFL
jgi:hypothetical protein